MEMITKRRSMSEAIVVSDVTQSVAATILAFTTICISIWGRFLTLEGYERRRLSGNGK